MTSSNSTLESCAKSLCSAPASFLIQFDYGAKVVWLADLAAGYEPSNVALCARHAERFTVPVGWELVDRSSAAPPLFVQEAVPVTDVAGVDDDASDAGMTGGSVVLRPDLRWELRDKSRRHPSVRGGAETGGVGDVARTTRDGIHIRRVRRDEDVPVTAAAAYDTGVDGFADDEHPSGPLDIGNRDELPHVAREIARIARELATESPAQFGPGSAFDPAPAPAAAVQMPLLDDDVVDADEAFGESLPSDEAFGESLPSDEAFGESLPSDEAFGESLPSDEAFGESLPFEYDQTVVIDRYEVPGPMFLGDEDSHLRPSSGSLPF